MKILLKLEDAALVLLSIYLFSLLPFAWWWYPLLILTPDASMVGFLGGKRVGAVGYNLFHHRALAIGVYLVGALLAVPVLMLAGVILLGHASFDRVLGFGLQDMGMTDSSPLTPVGPRG